MTQPEYQSYRDGYSRGKLAAEEGINMNDFLNDFDCPYFIEGAKKAYNDNLKYKFNDSKKKYLKDSLNSLKKGNISISDKFSLIEDSLMISDMKRIIDEDSRFIITEKDGEKSISEEYKASEIEEVAKRLDEDDNLEIQVYDQDSIIIGPKVKDATDAEYTINKINNDHYKVLKNGEEVYDLEKKKSNWTCSCPAFKYRGKCKHIPMLNESLPKRHPRSEIDAFLPEIEKVFDGFPRWEIVGSYRRKFPTFKDIDILVECEPSEFKKVLEKLQSDPNYKHTMAGNDIIRGTYMGYDFDVNRVPQGYWGSYLLYRTGSAMFNIGMRALAKKKGYSLNEKGLFDRNTGKLIANESEEAIFEALGLPYVEPEKRDTFNF